MGESASHFLLPTRHLMIEGNLYAFLVPRKFAKYSANMTTVSVCVKF